MEISDAVPVLSVLAHEARLAIFRLLVRAGPAGVKAGDIAEAVAAPASTVSAHLTALSHAGLIVGHRQGRAIYYAARYGRMRDLLAFLMEDCCNGSPDLCGPLVRLATRAAGCAAEPAAPEGNKAERLPEGA